MTQEALQTFLIQPGVQGIALLDELSRPYFHCPDRRLPATDRAAIANSVQAIVRSIPFNSQLLEFQFRQHKVQLHKLTNQQVFLTLLSPAHLLPTYPDSLDILLPHLRSNFVPLLEQLLATFDPPVLPPSEATSEYGLKESLAAINQLSQFTTQYLGIIVVVNYWSSSRPKVDWLSQFQIDRKLGITVSGGSDKKPSDSKLPDTLTVEQQQWFRDWIAAFSTRCGRVIRNYPTLLKQSNLDDRQRSLLFGNPD
jgi:hypothetical protein